MAYKVLVLLFVFFCVQAACLAQWVYDAEHPLRVSNREVNQVNPSVYPDGFGGCFVFWRVASQSSIDYRFYGQHFTASGARLFPDSGALILAPNKSVKDIAIE